MWQIKTWFFRAFELGKIPLTLAVIAIFFHFFILTLHTVRGASMEPNFQEGEWLLIDRISYHFFPPERGEVVVLEDPGSGEKFIKRIIGLPSEEIEIKEGKVFVDGRKLTEDWLKEAFTPSYLKIKIPEGEYFFLGDNRLHSVDSRAWGPLPSEVISGRAFFTLYPLRKFGAIPLPVF